MGLRLNYNRLIKDYLNYFYEELEFALEAWKQEVKNNIMSEFIKKHGNPQVNIYIEREEKALRAFLYANPGVLADSYGTGSLMNIQDNPLFQEYRNSEAWNPARTGKKIVGRKEGEYIDAFGRKKYSSGHMEGVELEYTETGTGLQFEPIPPSNVIKNANEWLYKTYLQVAYDNTLRKMNFSKYLEEVN